jgi:hypothetical protein
MGTGYLDLVGLCQLMYPAGLIEKMQRMGSQSVYSVYHTTEKFIANLQNH